MAIHEYLIKAIQDDARRTAERNRLLVEARMARRARRQHPVPAAPPRRRTKIGKIVTNETAALDGVTQDPVGDEPSKADGWAGLIGNTSRLATLALGDALAAGAFLLRRRS